MAEHCLCIAKQCLEEDIKLSICLRYQLIYYNTITNYILIIHELSNFNQVLSVVSQTRASGANRTHDSHANSLAHYTLDYQGTLHYQLVGLCSSIFAYFYTSGSYVSLLHIRQPLKPQAQLNRKLKIFLRGFPLNRFLAKSL